MPFYGLSNSVFLVFFTFENMRKKTSVLTPIFQESEKIYLKEKYIFGKHANFFNCYNESDTMFSYVIFIKYRK